MDLVDGILVAVLVLAMIHGVRVGAVSQLLSVLGFLVGLSVGVVLVLIVEPHVSSPGWKLALGVALLLLPATAVGSLARAAGFAAWRALRRGGLGKLDAVAGAAVAGGSALILAWLCAAILSNSSSTALNSALSRSAILRTVVRVMPPVPNAFATVQRYLSDNRFPEVLANVLPEHIGPTHDATTSQVAKAVERDGSSVVKIVALGCTDEQEGSGFVTAGGLVVTNAHVIAGTDAITVYASDGRSSPATPIYFDPDLDLAVLRTEPLGEPYLSVSDDYVERGGAAVVLGYPGGGPFRAVRAGVLARFDAVGRNIYDATLTTRTVYELQAIVRPGNSGGPLVEPTGEVIGVVFSRSTTNDDVGYALGSPPVLQGIERAAGSAARVSTEGCTS